MAAVTSVTLSLDPASREAMAASIESLAELVRLFEPKASTDSGNGIGTGATMRLDDTGDLVRIESADLPASGTRVLHGLKVKPTDRYIELFTALAGDDHLNAVSFTHDRPILSVAPSPATIAGRGDAASVSPDGSNQAEAA